MDDKRARKIPGDPLPKVDLRRLRGALDRLGEHALVQAMACDRQTVLRALAGLAVLPGTAALIRERLASADQKG